MEKNAPNMNFEIEWQGYRIEVACQTASNRDPLSAPNRDPSASRPKLSPLDLCPVPDTGVCSRPAAQRGALA